MRKAPLQVEALDQATGPYGYRNGWNPRALLAFACAVLPLLPGFIGTVGLLPQDTIPDELEELYRYAAPFGFFVAAVVFAVLQRFNSSGKAV